MSTTTTKPARVLTEEQRDQLWELFCSYGRLKDQAQYEWSLHKIDEAKTTEAESTQVAINFGDLLWSITEMAG